nr:hypothetical protein [Metamycoplasma hominis]
MNKTIIGKYLNYDTFIHKIDPRFKFLTNVLLIILLLWWSLYNFGNFNFLNNDFYWVATKSLKSLFSKLSLPLYIAIFLLIINMFTVKGASL